MVACFVQLGRNVTITLFPDAFLWEKALNILCKRFLLNFIVCGLLKSSLKLNTIFTYLSAKNNNICCFKEYSYKKFMIQFNKIQGEKLCKIPWAAEPGGTGGTCPPQLFR